MACWNVYRLVGTLVCWTYGVEAVKIALWPVQLKWDFTTQFMCASTPARAWLNTKKPASNACCTLRVLLQSSQWSLVYIVSSSETFKITTTHRIPTHCKVITIYFVFGLRKIPARRDSNEGIPFLIQSTRYTLPHMFMANVVVSLPIVLRLMRDSKVSWWKNWGKYENWEDEAAPLQFVPPSITYLLQMTPRNTIIGF